jgi:chitinase
LYKMSAPKRRLSLWRLLLGLLILAGLVASGFYGVRQWKDVQSTSTHKPWFAPYVDVTSTPTYAFEQLGATPNKEAMLSFVVASKNESCTPSWGAAYTMNQANSSLDLDRRIARLRQQGGNVGVSFGGLSNSELAVSCTDFDKLKDAYESVVKRYDIDTIDLDLENQGLTDKDAGARRALAIATLQSERRAKGKHLAVWVTLPVAPQGLSQDGTDAVAQLLAKGVDITGINVMTMDYGQSLQGQTMLDGSKSALIETHRQLGILYDRAGTHQGSATLWSKLGATPMIGQNDITDETFTMSAAKGLNEFARDHNMSRMSMWSANRDIACGENYVDVKVVSDSCSGVKQEKQAFAVALSEGFEGKMSQSADTVTKKEETATEEQSKDDPATSPYQIWSADGTYLQGTKVVWHHNVYEAKWWTHNELPDNPSLNAWETPWKLVGPVLPGEKPIQQATLPTGTYPEWSGTTGYDTGARVLFNGVPYQAKWWNSGQSPAAASANASLSPWVPLTQAQIEEVQTKQAKTQTSH